MTAAPAKEDKRRRLPRWTAWLAVLLVAPQQTVNVAGQVIMVGATAPTLSLSGPGEIDLFGQSLPTNLHFLGPVRPRLQLSQITINSELTNFVRGAHPAGAAKVLGNVLADGWIRYFAWETVITALGALLILGAVAGWRRLAHRTTLKLLAAGLVVTEAINLGAIMVTAYQAPGSLRQVHSLNQLVGSEPPVEDLTKAAPVRPGVQVVVIGDSTAAGAGLAPMHNASRSDLACGRSTDAYAEDLARANNWNVLNLACDSATIPRGLLGPQGRGGQTVPAQLDEVQQARSASVVIVSVGADDLGWSAMVQYCAVAPNCDDRASAAYFQQQLASFSKNYLQLLSQLETLPEHPRVLINRYYDPFGPDVSCLRPAGLTGVKIRTLTSRLNTLNAVLAKGAADFGFGSTQPDFAGHQMCTPQPFVQGLQGSAPFHPTALGQFAIALADQAALTNQPPLRR
jgi:lysophospholipase L1-like esterase